jgi:acyl-CoA hydrolase
MDLKRSRTEKNLRTALAGESQARNSYIFFAEKARAEDLPLIADVFLEIAQNEEEHARHFFQFLGGPQDTARNLETSAEKEHEEHSIFYPELARTAREEGFETIAECFEEMIQVEKRHEEICRELGKTLEGNSPILVRTVGHSSITLAQVMLPHQANRAGNVHGGEVMKLMDSAAGVVAARHSHCNCVTARVEDLNFLKPVKVGDLIFAHAFLTFVSRSSMEIRVEVETEDRFTEARQKALTARFIFVALAANGKPTEVPTLLITTEEGQKYFEEGRKRHEGRKK